MQTLPSFASPVVLRTSPKNRFLIGSEHVAKILQNAGLNRHLESQLIASCLAFNELTEEAQMNTRTLWFGCDSEVSIAVRSGHIMIEVYNEELSELYTYKLISHSDIVFTEIVL